MEGFASLDADLRETTVVTRRVGDARTGRKSPPALTVETHHVTTRADERTAVGWTGADGEPGFGDRQVTGGRRGLGDDAEPTGAVSSGDGEAVVVRLDDDRIRAGEPRDGLVAVCVVDKRGVVGSKLIPTSKYTALSKSSVDDAL